MNQPASWGARATLLLLLACGDPVAGTYHGSGTLNAAIHQPDFTDDNRSVPLTTVRIERRGKDDYELTLGDECHVSGDGFSFGLRGASPCTLKTPDGKRVHLDLISFTAQQAHGELVLSGMCVSRRDDGLKGSCLLDFTGKR